MFLATFLSLIFRFIKFSSTFTFDFLKYSQDSLSSSKPISLHADRNLIFDVSQTALDLNYDGLMIETHSDPDNAWSDASQQVTPKRLVEIMKDLKMRKITTDEELVTL